MFSIDVLARYKKQKNYGKLFHNPEISYISVDVENYINEKS